MKINQVVVSNKKDHKVNDLSVQEFVKVNTCKLLKIFTLMFFI